MMQQDSHPADIISALQKRGTSLAEVSRNAGLVSSTLTNALNRRWLKGEG
jgi:Ner family transcriptional regulator